VQHFVCDPAPNLLPCYKQAGELGGLEDDDGDEEEGEADAPPAATRDASGGTSSSNQAAAGAPRRAAAAAAAAAQSQLLSSYLVCCVEEPAGAGAGRGSHAVDIGLVAVEPSTGAVLHSQFRCLGAWVAAGRWQVALLPPDYSL
jgi:hypothetical protein